MADGKVGFPLFQPPNPYTGPDRPRFTHICADLKRHFTHGMRSEAAVGRDCRAGERRLRLSFFVRGGSGTHTYRATLK